MNSDRFDTFRVGLIFPMSGPFGIIGPSSELSAQLARDELNTSAGVLGRRVELMSIDGGRDPVTVAHEVATLLDAGALDAVAGMHTSAVRRAVIPVTLGRIPYVYTSMYEGGDRYPGLFITGETPANQLVPALEFLVREFGRRRWAIVGNDYVWPRKSASITATRLRELGASVVHAEFAPVGSTDFAATVTAIERSGADATVVLLIGDDAVHFHQQFAGAGLDAHCIRLSPLMDENMLLAAGGENTHGLYVASGYFETLATEASLAFSSRFARSFGVDAPIVGALGQSCYEGITLLGALVNRAGTADVRIIESVSDSVSFTGARGHLFLSDGHVSQPIYLALAGAVDFEIIGEIRPARD
jgi:urea transport system substrate-binding protein